MILVIISLGFLWFLGALVVLSAMPYRWSKSIIRWFEGK